MVALVTIGARPDSHLPNFAFDGYPDPIFRERSAHLRVPYVVRLALWERRPFPAVRGVSQFALFVREFADDAANFPA